MNDNNFNKKIAELPNQVLKPRGRKCCKLISFLMPITGFLSKLSEEEYSIIFVLETLSTLTISTKAYAALLSDDNVIFKSSTDINQLVNTLLESF